jgi:hypothetical protein
VHGEVALDLVALVAQVADQAALEARGREAVDVEEVGAAQVGVTPLVAGVDAGDVDLDALALWKVPFTEARPRWRTEKSMLVWLLSMDQLAMSVCSWWAPAAPSTAYRSGGSDPASSITSHSAMSCQVLC